MTSSSLSTDPRVVRRIVRAVQLGIFAVWPACIMTASVMNFLEAGTELLPWMFTGFMALSFAILHKLRAVIPEHSSQEMLFLVFGALVLSLPRLAYLLEPVLGASVNAVAWDD